MRSEWGDGDHDAAGVSPRISFSNDFAISEELTSAGDHDAAVDFDFDFDFDFTLCSDVPTLADDLFSEGKLLPLPIKRPSSTTFSSSPPPAPSPSNPPLKQPVTTSSSNRNGNSPQDENLASGRSFSLRKALIWSSSSIRLLRSKSSGASPELANIKQWSSQRSSSLNFSSVGSQRRFCRNCPIPLPCRSKSASPRATQGFKPCNSPSGDNTKSRVYYYSGNWSSRRSSHGNNKAVRISPILNVPMPRCMGIFNLCFPYKRGV